MDPLQPLKKKKKKKSGGIPLAQDVIADTPMTVSDPRLPVSFGNAVSNGASPQDLAAAKQFLGNKDFIGLCEKFVEQATGSAQKWGSAIESWLGQQDKAVPGLQGIQPGDKIYFGADNSNGGYGHVGVMSQNGNFVSATDSGVKEVPLADWVKQTGQRPLGYIPNKG